MSFSVVERQAPVRIYRSKLFVPGSKTNFFEKRVAEYQKAGVMKSTEKEADQKFSLNEDF